MSIDYNEFQAGQGVSASAMNQNFSKTNDAVNALEVSINTNVSMLNTNISLKADKNGSVSEAFNVANATETSHSVNLSLLKQYVPAGTVIWSARSSAPSGWLICNGAAVSRTTYADLFTAIGTAFGNGDGSTTFNLPLLTDQRFIRGWTSSGASGNAVNTILPAHSHTLGTLTMAVPGTYIGEGSALVGMTTNTTSTTGWGGDCFPKYLQLVPCIKY
ncbi:MAG: phage tail protein [Candidatus Gastranaerophilales bacterium]|nr:phage tail protein [Candidatus Gastranaerophilales bacterium]